MDTPPTDATKWLAIAIAGGSIVGAVVLRDDWLAGREAECLLVWLAWSVAAFFVLRRLKPDGFRNSVLFSIPIGFSNLCVGVAHDHALLGDTTLAHMLAAGIGVAVAYPALAWALARSDARRRGAGVRT